MSLRTIWVISARPCVKNKQAGTEKMADSVRKALAIHAQGTTHIEVEGENQCHKTVLRLPHMCSGTYNTYMLK